MTARDYLLQLTRTLPYKAWAATSPVDARKVELELRGIRRPWPASLYGKSLVGLARLHPPTPPPDPAPAPPSLFARLGTLVASASAFPVDSPSAAAFRAAGGTWVAVQFHDPATHGANTREIIDQRWMARWQAQGVRILGWHRVEHPVIRQPPAPPMDGWLFNAETEAENLLLIGQASDYRQQHPAHPVAVVTLGKQPAFPTGILQTLDAHLIPECFPEEGSVDDTVASSVAWWLRSGVPLERIHPCLLFKDGVQRLPVMHAHEARVLGVHGLSSFVGENTPHLAWAVMA